MNYEPNLGLYDMRRDATGLPRSLANKINSNICCGGGGGGSQTTTTGIDPEFKPQLVESLNMSNQQLRDQMSGKKKIIADMTPQQLEALSYAEGDAKDQILGRGKYDITGANYRDLQKLYGSSMGNDAYRNTTGSARSMASRDAAIANKSAAQQRLAQQSAVEGMNRLGKVGSSYQKGEQAQLDSTSRALDDYFKRLTGAAGKESTTTGGGGK